MNLITVSGTLETPAGVPLENVAVQFLLQGYGSYLPRVIGTGALADLMQSVTTDVNGNFTASLVGNDQIMPGAALAPPQTYYLVSVAGQPVPLGAYQFTGSAAVNLNGIEPMSTLPPANATNELGSISGNVTLGLIAGVINHGTLAGNVTLSTGPFAANQFYALRITQNSASPYTVAFPANMHGAGPVSPILNSENVQLFVSDASGVTLYAVSPMVAQ